MQELFVLWLMVMFFNVSPVVFDDLIKRLLGKIIAEAVFGVADFSIISLLHNSCHFEHVAGRRVMRKTKR
jgi:hypothetical protein